ncbi:MAG: hypothetical protein RLZZ165_321 [Bacteroidota bacterium]
MAKEGEQLRDGNVLLHEWKSVEGRAPDPDDVVTGRFVPAAKLKGDRRYSIPADPLGTPTRIHDGEGGLVKGEIHAGDPRWIFK